MNDAPVPQDQPLEDLLQRGFRFALALTHNEDQAGDLLQDAWLAMLRREAPRHVGYLFRTLRNRFLDQQRRQRLVAIEPLELVPDNAEELGFLDEASLFPEVGTISQALADLRPSEREVLFLAAVEGYTVREIAELTSHPLGTVSSLIQRARRKVISFYDQGSEGRASSGQVSGKHSRARTTS